MCVCVCIYIYIYIYTHTHTSLGIWNVIMFYWKGYKNKWKLNLFSYYYQPFSGGGPVALWLTWHHSKWISTLVARLSLLLD